MKTKQTFEITKQDLNYCSRKRKDLGPLKI